MLYLSLENNRYQTNFRFTYRVTINGKERCLQKKLRYEETRTFWEKLKLFSGTT